MPKTACSVSVNAPVETVWNLLIDKIRHPERYVPGVTRVTILEASDAGVLREMTAGGLKVTERITQDAERREVVFTLVDHPVYMGQVVNRIAVGRDGRPVLEYVMNWMPRACIEAPQGADLAAAVRGTVLHLKELAERTAPR